MTDPAIIFNGTAIYWSTMVIMSGALSALFLTAFLYRSMGGETLTVSVSGAFAAVLAVAGSKACRWLCQPEKMLWSLFALEGVSSGAYSMVGLLLGWILAIGLAAFILRRTYRQTMDLYDSYAPAMALLAAIIRLSLFFSSADRGRYEIRKPMFQKLPFAVRIGEGRFVLATFFLQFLVLCLLLALLLVLFFVLQEKRSPGMMFVFFLQCYASSDFLLESTRNDAAFLPFNGFISFSQGVDAVVLVALMIYLLMNTPRGQSGRQMMVCTGWVLALAGAGMCEYLVQRHADQWLLCYLGMAAFLLALTGFSLRLYSWTYKKGHKRKKSRAV
ncbi:MAG: prolipoprotein diacylglyceryl transferase [Oscillospiraceae bacterium]|nr:prolipoprotein diacylglyceryl transferase [Oscillospiraceae bacterium]